jgi:LCP family protein required for cell wall assembly
VSTPREPGPSDPRQPLPPELDPRGRSGRGRPPEPGGGSARPQPRPPAGPPPSSRGQSGGPSGGSGGGSSGGQSGGGWSGGGGGGSGDRYGDLYGWSDERAADLPPVGPRLPRPPTGGSGGSGGSGGFGGPGGGRQRTSKQKAALAAKIVAGVVSLAVLVTSGFLYFLYRDFNSKVTRVNAIGKSTVNDVDGRDENILLVGSDDRSTATPAELKELGTENDPAKNTDTMILVHIPANGQKATAVSFPRDSYVNIPGFGKNKLNSAYADGAYGSGGKPDPDKGRRLLVQTISELSGIQIDHYVEVDLLGFYRITKAIDGVEVCLNHAAKDRFSGIDLPAGKQTIEGTQALAFVRQRHGLPNGDLDRIARQQYFLSAVFRKIKSAGVITNPLKLTHLMNAIGTSLRMDTGLDPLALARQVHGLADGNIQFKTVPNKGSANVDGKSVVLLDNAALPAFFKSVIGSSGGSGGKSAVVKTVPRGQVSVQVFNGSGRKGLATQTATQLRSAGFQVAGTANADRNNYQQTQIRYAAANVAQANTLAQAIPGAQLTEASNVSGVQLVLGADFAGVKSSGSSGSGGSSSTRTTGPPASSSSNSGNSANAPARTAADAGCIN